MTHPAHYPSATPSIAFAPPSPTQVPGEYEFSAPEDTAIKAAAGATRSWGQVSVFVGILNALIGLITFGAGPTAWINLLSGAVGLVVGVVFLAAGWLDKITTTRGQDITHLLAALGKLAGAFRFQAVVTMIALLAGGILGYFGGRL